VGFESKAGARSVANVLMEQDAEKRKAMHKDIVDYSMYWLHMLVFTKYLRVS